MHFCPRLQVHFCLLVFRTSTASRSVARPITGKARRSFKRLELSDLWPRAQCTTPSTLFPSWTITQTDASRLTSASKNFMGHILPPVTNSNFASPSTRMALSQTAASFTNLFDIGISASLFGRGPMLTSTTSCTSYVLFSSASFHGAQTSSIPNLSKQLPSRFALDGTLASTRLLHAHFFLV